jgi:hypothetical protein
VWVQWDPERDCRLNIVEDLRAMTPIAHRLAADLKSGVIPEDLPDKLEMPYPLNPALRRKPSRTILPTAE